jgi:hypothetical protein
MELVFDVPEAVPNSSAVDVMSVAFAWHSLFIIIRHKLKKAFSVYYMIKVRVFSVYATLIIDYMDCHVRACVRACSL